MTTRREKRSGRRTNARSIGVALSYGRLPTNGTGGRAPIRASVTSTSALSTSAVSTKSARSASSWERRAAKTASHLRNAQPLTVDCARGQIAIAHNGNLTNAAQLREELEAKGSIF